jgi:general secretion pathway protein G
MQATLERLRQRREEIRGEGGFTLIELLIVIVILGILAAIVVFAVSNLTTSSSQAGCGSDQKTVQTAVEAYKAQLGVYPGGTVASTYTYTAGTPTTGYPADGATAATQYTSAMQELQGKYVNGSVTIGPWLKTTPYNQSHYSIVVSNDGVGTVSVLNGSGAAATCATLTS